MDTVGQLLLSPVNAIGRHYEIVILIHPDQSEQVAEMLDRWGKIVVSGGGKVHRIENWGKRQLAYKIQKLAKAHYICINVECDRQTIEELETGFRYNAAVLRHLTVVKAQAEKAPSVMMKTLEREESSGKDLRRLPASGAHDKWLQAFLKEILE